jgi:hypothetical protein
MPYLDTVDEVTRALAGYGYIADRQLATALPLRPAALRAVLRPGRGGP